MKELYKNFSNLLLNNRFIQKEGGAEKAPEPVSDESAKDFEDTTYLPEADLAMENTKEELHRLREETDSRNAERAEYDRLSSTYGDKTKPAADRNDAAKKLIPHLAEIGNTDTSVYLHEIATDTTLSLENREHAGREVIRICSEHIRADQKKPSFYNYADHYREILTALANDEKTCPPAVRNAASRELKMLA